MADYPDFDALTDPAAFRPAPPPPDFADRAGQMFADGSKPATLNPFPKVGDDAASALADATPTSGKDDEYTTEQKRLIAQSKERTERSDASQEKTEALQAEEKKRLDPKYAQLDSLMNRPKPERPQYGKAPPPPENPFIKGGGQEYMGIMSVFAGLMGALGRSNATTTMAAFGGAMKGYAEGNEEVFQQQSKEWEMANKKMLEDNQAKMDAYKEILQDQQMDVTQKQNEIKLIASQYGDEITYNMQNTNHWDKSAQAYEHMVQVNEQMRRQSDRQEMELAKFNNTLEQQKAADDAALRPIARQIVKGNAGAANMLGRNPKTRRRLAELVEEERQTAGITPEQQNALTQEYTGRQREMNALSTRAGNVLLASNEAEAIIPVVLHDAEMVNRTGLAKWNEAQGMWDIQTGDANYAKLISSLNDFIGVYARTQAGTASATVEQRNHYREIINANQPIQAIKASLQRARTIIKINREQAQKSRDDLRQQMMDMGGGQQSSGGGGWEIVK